MKENLIKTLKERFAPVVKRICAKISRRLNEMSVAQRKLAVVGMLFIVTAILTLQAWLSYRDIFGAEDTETVTSCDAEVDYSGIMGSLSGTLDSLQTGIAKYDTCLMKMDSIKRSWDEFLSDSTIIADK